MLIKHFDNHQDTGQINEFGECYFESSQTPTGECSIGQNIGGMITSMIAEDSGGTGLVNPVTASKNLGDYMMSVGHRQQRRNLKVPLTCNERQKNGKLKRHNATRPESLIRPSGQRKP